MPPTVAAVGTLHIPCTDPILLNLRSGLLFTCRALQEVRANPREEKLQPSFSRAYDSVLRHHHGPAMRTVVQVALKACPNRREFYLRICQGGSQERLDEELTRWLSGLDDLVQCMSNFHYGEDAAAPVRLYCVMPLNRSCYSLFSFLGGKAV